jgi:hypothetical protein
MLVSLLVLACRLLLLACRLLALTLVALLSLGAGSGLAGHILRALLVTALCGALLMASLAGLLLGLLGGAALPLRLRLAGAARVFLPGCLCRGHSYSGQERHRAQ